MYLILILIIYVNIRSLFIYWSHSALHLQELIFFFSEKQRKLVTGFIR